MRLRSVSVLRLCVFSKLEGCAYSSPAPSVCVCVCVCVCSLYLARENRRVKIEGFVLCVLCGRDRAHARFRDSENISRGDEAGGGELEPGQPETC